jgi:autotransporter-associated beta strand protein
LIAVLLADAITAVPARAQSATWTGTASTSWNATGNWSPSSVPTNTATFGASSQSDVTFGSPSTSIQTIDINTGSNNYTFSLGGNTLNLISASSGIIDTSAATISFLNGNIAGGGIVDQLGTGTLILSGTDTYTGVTTVNNGTLQVNGSIVSALEVNANATLSGTGTIANTIISRATLAPGTAGDPTGTLSVKGNITFSSEATYLVTVNGPVLNSALNVLGSATVSGTVVAVAAPGTAGSYSAADTFTILTAASGVGHTFGSIVTTPGGFGNLVPVLMYPPTSTGAVTSVVMGLTAGTVWQPTTASGGVYYWDTTTNWAGGVVPTAIGESVSTPNGVVTEPSTTVATFGGTANTSIVINTAATAGTFLFTSGVTSPFTITLGSGSSLTLNAIGIDDNSSHPPQIIVGSASGGATLQFVNSATAGDAVITNGGSILFGVSGGIDKATAGTSTITNSTGAVLTFYADTTAGSATIVTNNGGATVFDNNSTSGNATMVVEAGANIYYNGNGTLSNPNNVSAAAVEGTGGTINLGSNTLTITNGTGSFAGVIGGVAGLDIAGGITTLTGTNTYTGATAIGGGTLSVMGSIASSSGVTLSSAGTLSGTGIVPGVTVAAGGTLAPGANGAGTLTINGNLSVAAGGDYAPTINGSGNSAAAVSGTHTATLAGIFTAVAGSGSFSAGQTYTVLSTAAASGVSGTFSGLSIAGSFGNLVPYLSYSPIPSRWA